MHTQRKVILCSIILGLVWTFGQTSEAISLILPPYQLIRYLSAGTANQDLINQGRASLQTLPFLDDSQVAELRTTADGYYIRYFVYDPNRSHNGAVGSWMMLTVDVMGKSLDTVKDNYALPRFPDHFVVIKVPAGTRMRTGTAGPIAGWGQGGGQQVLLMEYIGVSDYQTIASLPGTVRSGAFAPQSHGRNAGNTAAYLDSLAPGDPFSYLQIVRLSLYYLEGNAFDIALNNLGPERYDALNRAGLEQGLIFGRAMLDPAAQGMITGQQGSYAVWGGVTGGLAGYDSKGEHSGFNLISGGIMTGIDYLLGSRLSMGVAVGYLQSDLDFAQNGGTGKSRSMNLGLRGTYQQGPFSLALHISGAALHEELDRKLIFSGVDRTAHGELDGYRLSAGTEAGWTTEFGDHLAITPYAGVSLVDLFHQGCTESNAEDIDLKVQGFEGQTLVPELGIRLTKEIITDDNPPLSLKAGLAYSPQIPLDDRKIEASFANQRGSFFAYGQDETLHVFIPSLSLSIKTMSGIEASLGYTGNLAEGLNAYRFTAALSCRF